MHIIELVAHIERPGTCSRSVTLYTVWKIIFYSGISFDEHALRFGKGLYNAPLTCFYSINVKYFMGVIHGCVKLDLSGA